MTTSAAHATNIHPQVTTSRDILVDELLVDLLEGLWVLGLDTQFSCQGVTEDSARYEPGFRSDTYVSFANVDDGRWLSKALDDLWLRHEFTIAGPIERFPYERSVIRFSATNLAAVTAHIVLAASTTDTSGARATLPLTSTPIQKRDTHG